MNVGGNNGNGYSKTSKGKRKYDSFFEDSKPEKIERQHLKAVAYTRVSTEDQAKEGYSLDAQLDKIKSYIKSKDWDYVGEYIEEGKSGRTADRPKYQNMLRDRDNWDIIVVLKMDRIHRNSKNFTEMMLDLKDTGKEFTSVSESLDTTTAMGRFVVDILQRLAQLESEHISERVLIGMTQKAKNGGYLGGKPFGYDIVNGDYAVNEVEAKTLRNMITDYLENNIMFRDIAIKYGKSQNGIQYMLGNPIYCGFKLWRGILEKSNHTPLMTVKEYNLIQIQRSVKGRIRRKAPLFLINNGKLELVNTYSRQHFGYFECNGRLYKIPFLMKKIEKAFKNYLKGKGLSLSISADAFGKAERYTTKDGTEFVPMFIRLASIYQILEGEKEVTNVSQLTG